MLAAWVWTSAVYFTFLNMHNAAAQSQMCNEPFQAVMTLVTNVTLPISTDFSDSDLVFYRKVLLQKRRDCSRKGDRNAVLQK